MLDYIGEGSASCDPLWNQHIYDLGKLRYDTHWYHGYIEWCADNGAGAGNAAEGQCGLWQDLRKNCTGMSILHNLADSKGCCIDIDWTWNDYQTDNCNYYKQNYDVCGYFDGDGHIAKEQCCACGGGFERE